MQPNAQQHNGHGASNRQKLLIFQEMPHGGTLTFEGVFANGRLPALPAFRAAADLMTRFHASYLLLSSIISKNTKHSLRNHLRIGSALPTQHRPPLRNYASYRTDNSRDGIV
jgi:hypothetical protein